MPNPRLTRGLKAVTGTLRPSREAEPLAGEQLRVAPLPPAGLPALAAGEWRNLAAVLTSAGTLTASDLRALELLAVTLATEAEAREVVQREGFTVATADGGAKPHPAVRMMETARAQAAALLRDFGLTPKARQSVGAAPAPGGEFRHGYF